MVPFNFGETFDKSIEKEENQILKTPLCLNFSNLENDKCDFAVLITQGICYLNIKDFDFTCKGHSNKNKCCWYRPFKIVYRKNGNFRGKK